MSESPQTTPGEPSPRLLGGILVVCGSGLAYLGVYRPLAALWAHAESISYLSKATFGAPIALGIGLIYLIFGPSAVRAFGHPQSLDPRLFGLVLLFAAVGFGLTLWLQRLVAANGYG